VARAALPRRLSWQLARVRSLIAESPTARSLVLEIDDWPGHRAGQHLDIRLTAEDGYQAQRSFSIATAPEDDAVAITVEEIADGEVSPYLVEDVIVGDELEVRGPIGGPFTWSVDDGGPLVLVAGGSGLVPLMSMLRHRAAQGSALETHVLISVRTEVDALYRAELLRLEPRAGLDVRWTYTRAPVPPAGGWTGRVTAAMLDAVVPPASAAPRVFICGPTGFVEHVATLVVDAGHDPLRVRTERFGPT
jgi:ferredoxin-NADP reductase